MHDFGVQFIPFKLGNLKKFIEGKKDAAKSAREARYPLMQSKTLKATTRGTLFSRCRLRLCDFSFLRSIISIYKLLFFKLCDDSFFRTQTRLHGKRTKTGKNKLGRGNLAATTETRHDSLVHGDLLRASFLQ